MNSKTKNTLIMASSLLRYCVAYGTLCQLRFLVSLYVISTCKFASQMGYYFLLCGNPSHFTLKRGVNFPFIAVFKLNLDLFIPYAFDFEGCKLHILLWQPLKRELNCRLFVGKNIPNSLVNADIGHKYSKNSPQVACMQRSQAKATSSLWVIMVRQFKLRGAYFSKAKLRVYPLEVIAVVMPPEFLFRLIGIKEIT